jgi:hypothetical protein
MISSTFDGHRRGDAQEELVVRYGDRMMRGVRVRVAAIEEVPVLLACAMAVEPPVGDPGLRHMCAILPDLLALVVRERREEFVEARVTLVAPAELDAVPVQHARADDRARLVRLGKSTWSDDAFEARASSTAARHNGARSAGSRAINRVPVAGVNGTAPSSFG